MQSTRNWGENAGAGDGNGAAGAGDDNASDTANDNDTNVGIHQAYAQFDNFLNIPLGWTAKIGRQEVLLDGWRLFGNTIWTTGMQTHDMVRLTHKHDNTTVSAAYILRNEDGRADDRTDDNDFDVYLLHLNQKGVLGGQFSGYYVYSDSGCGTGVITSAAADTQKGCSSLSNDYHTIGGRQAGTMFGLKYRAELYYQFGDAMGIGASTGATDHASYSSGQQMDREAYMYGVRVTKAFNNVMYKPAITLWFDYLSGTSDDDVKNGKWKSFDTLYDTGHKYYGLQDIFLGVGNQAGGKGTQGLGLQDFAVKLKLNPIAGWTLKVDHHHFYTAEGVNASPIVTDVSREGQDSHFLGTEIDVTAVHKMNSNTKVMIGYSNFDPSLTFRKLRASSTGDAADANWAYVQFDVKF